MFAYPCFSVSLKICEALIYDPILRAFSEKLSISFYYLYTHSLRLPEAPAMEFLIIFQRHRKIAFFKAASTTLCVGRSFSSFSSRYSIFFSWHLPKKIKDWIKFNQNHFCITATIRVHLLRCCSAVNVRRNTLYFFRSIYKRFLVHWVKVFKQNRLKIAFAVISIVDPALFRPECPVIYSRR